VSTIYDDVELMLAEVSKWIANGVEQCQVVDGVECLVVVEPKQWK
jgi:hypothetical protein